MSNRHALQMWTGSLIVVFCVAVIAFAYVSRRPLCIDSKLVEKIDRVTESGTHTAYRCALRKHVPYDGKLKKITRNFGQRLVPVERFLEYLGNFHGRISLTLLKSSETYFKIRDHEIYATEELLNSPGQLEKAVMKIWLRDQMQNLALENSLSEEVLSDFLWTTLKGRLDLYDPVTRLNLGQEPLTLWPETLKNSAEVCQSPWWAAKSAVICQALRTTKESDSQIDLDSMRPLLTQSLNSAYKKIPAAQKIAWLQAFAKNLPHFQLPEGAEKTTHDFSQAQRVVGQWISSFRLVDENFGNLFAHELAYHNFHDLTAMVHFSALIIFDQTSKEGQDLVEKDLQSFEQSHLIGYKNGQQVQFSSHGVSVLLEDLGAWQADKIVMISCGSPQIEKLQDLAVQADRLLFVDLCQNKGNLDVVSYLKEDAQTFAARNKNVNFIEFHLPSLKLALQKVDINAAQKNNWIADLLNENPKDKTKKVSILTEALGWQEPIYHSQEKAYRSQSAIEAINWYRMN